MNNQKPGKSKQVVLVTIVCTCLLGGGTFVFYGRSIWGPIYRKIIGGQTIESVLDQYGDQVRLRLKPAFDHAKVHWPPQAVTLLAIKDTKVLELWALSDERFELIRTYPILAASGHTGPKRREGDRQVPEGIYDIVALNPNSSYHLSLKINYPNSFDRLQAQQEGRTDLGSNIFIHGKDRSIGCLAIGDQAIEELFVLAALIGKEQMQIAIAPSDPRKVDWGDKVNRAGQPVWVEDLYSDLTEIFAKYPLTSTHEH